jgi:hypothetical protein
MPGELRMTLEEMREGFSRGSTLTQEEWAHPSEIKWVNDLIAEGAATATDWQYKDNFQCAMRRVTGVVGSPDHE